MMISRMEKTSRSAHATFLSKIASCLSAGVGFAQNAERSEGKHVLLRLNLPMKGHRQKDPVGIPMECKVLDKCRFQHMQAQVFGNSPYDDAAFE